MTKHPKADLLIAIANGEQMQILTYTGWSDCNTQIALGFLVNRGYEVRIKPKTITINGIEVPAPVTEPPRFGQEYWTFGVVDNVVFNVIWRGNIYDELRLRRRTIHLTKEAAQAHLEAFVKANGGEV